jgi:hypothetical protein
MKHEDFLGGIGVIALTVLIIINLWPDNLIATTLLLILSAITIFHWRTHSDIFHFVVPAILGPLAESICIFYGAWTYSNPTLIIPIWLPLVWGLAGISIGRLVDYFINKRRRT